MRLHVFLLLLCFFDFASAATVVTELPGFDGELPFYLETGYIGVGESEESQLFYYFVESQRSPGRDPLMLWLTGGPGCSVLSAFFYETGPVAFNYANYSGGLPSLHLNPFAWTQSINIIYVDTPVGAGFSYSTTQENYYVNDIKSAAQTYEFLRKWLIEHPYFIKNQLFIGGDSYSGIPLPMIVQHVLDGNQIGLEPIMNLKGYILGNPVTDSFIDANSQVPFAHRLTLISTELYESLKEYCGGDYVNINASNTECVTAMHTYDEMVLQINVLNVLEPNCVQAKPRKIKGRRSLGELDPTDIPLRELKNGGAYWCRDYNYVLSGVWANDRRVRDALHVRDNTKGVWKRCNVTNLAYTKNVLSTVGYHQNLTKTSLRALIYSGDHDFSVPSIGTQNWIHLLNLTTNEYWRPWFIDGQVTGYTEKFLSSTGDFTLIYATVKGAGHVAPEYKRKECYSMDLRTGEILLQGKTKDGVYEWPTSSDKSSPLVAFSSVKATSSEWHHRLGHPASFILKHIVSKFKLELSSPFSIDFNCNACQCNKSHKLPFSVSSLVSTSPLEIIYFDIWTSFIYSFDDFKYYVIFIDHFTKYI